MTLGNVNFDIANIIANINSAESAKALSLKNLIYKEYREVKGITDFNALKTGIKCNSKIGFIDLGNDFGFMISTEGLASGCEYNECEANITTSTKTWNTHGYNCEIKFCKADMECAFAEWFGLNCNHADGEQDITDAFILFLSQYIAEKMKRAHWRIVWFNDSSLATTSALYGGDGIWAKALVSATANDNVIDIPENDNADYATQDALDPQRGFEVYSAIYDKILMDYKFSGKDMVILSTKRLAYNYLQYLRTHNQIECCFKQDVTSSVYDLYNLNIYGMPIVIVDEFDTIIREAGFTDLNDGTRWSNPHRVIATYKNNIPFGTCDAEVLDKVEVEYDKINKIVHLRSEFEIGTEVIFDDEVIVAI